MGIWYGKDVEMYCFPKEKYLRTATQQNENWGNLQTLITSDRNENLENSDKPKKKVVFRPKQ